MSNANRVSIDNLSKEIMKALTNYNHEIEEEVENTSKEVIKEARDELERISPIADHTVTYTYGSKTQKTIVKPGEYAKNWKIKENRNKKNQYSQIIYNKKHYRLTHLTEFKHVNKSGTGYTKSYPHIRPTEAKYKELFAQRLERKIGRS